MDFFPGLAVNAWKVVSRRSTRTGSGRTRRTLGPPAIDNDMVGYTIDGVCGTGETGLAESSSDDDLERELSRKAGAPGRACTAKGLVVRRMLLTCRSTPSRSDLSAATCGDIGAHVDDLDRGEHLWLPRGEHLQAVQYQKWKAWAARQGWATEFLDHAVTIEANEDKLLGFLGYLGWLGASFASHAEHVDMGGAADGPPPRGYGGESFRRHHGAHSAQHGLVLHVEGEGVLQIEWHGLRDGAERRESELSEDGSGGLRDPPVSQNQDRPGGLRTCKTMYRSGVAGLCVASALRAFRSSCSSALRRWPRGSEADFPMGE